MKRRVAVLIGLGTVLLATTVTSSTASARQQPVVRAHVASSGAQLRFLVRTSAEARGLAKKAGSAFRKLQSSGNGIICLGGGATTAGTVGTSIQKCSVTGSSAVCIEVSTDQTADQTCTLTQASVGKTNLAIVLQLILQRNSAEAGINSQGGTQTATVTQMNVKPNLSFAAQILKQSLGRGANNTDNEASQEAAVQNIAELLGVLPDFSPLISSLQASESQQEGDESPAPPSFGPAVSQSQQSQQTLHVCQGGPSDCHSPVGTTGKNLSAVYQSLRQRERAGNSVAIDQHQNPADGTCATVSPTATNMCAIVDQNTTDPGKNLSAVAELYRQFQSGFNAHSLTQEQDPNFNDTNGLDHDIHQTSVGLTTGPRRNTILTFQWARQVQRAANIDTSLNQFQDPRTAKGFDSFQTGSALDSWFGRQLATQLQTNNGAFSGNLQEQRLTYDGDTTGSFDVLQRGTQNDSTAQNTCSGQFCHVTVICNGGGESGPADCFVPGDFTAMRRR